MPTTDLITMMDEQLQVAEMQLTHQWMRGMIDLLRDESGWSMLSGTTGGSVEAGERVATVQSARQYALKDPLCRRTLQLYRVLCLGTPYTMIPVEGAPGGDIAERVWSNPANACIFDVLSQWNLCDRFLTDGEVFIEHWGEGAETRIRLSDPLQIERIVSDPDDAAEPWWFCRSWMRGQKLQRVAYPAVRVDWRDPKVIAEVPEGYTAAGEMEGWGDVAVSHKKILAPFDRRGNSIFTGALSAAKGWRTFMESRLAIALAIARYAWKKKHSKAGPAQVSAMAAADRSTLVTSDDEDNPPPAFGSNQHEGAGTDTTPMPQQTGGSDATQNAALFIARFGQFTGFPPYYYGVETLSRMATAGAMDRPVREMLEAWQLVLAEVMGDAIGYAVDPEADWSKLVTWEYQKIAEEDVLAAATQATNVAKDLPALYDVPEYLQWLASAWGIEDPEALAEKILEAAEDRLARAPTSPPAGQQPPFPQQPPPPSNGRGQTAEEIAQSITGLARGVRQMRLFMEGDDDADAS